MLDPTSFLFITIDSCRYDVFAAARAPHLKSVGPLHCAMAPGNFTYSSHAAMFMGFTPGVATAREAYLNPKYGKIFKIVAAGFPGVGREFVALQGRNIIEGLKRLGYVTLGSGGVGWFDPETPTGRLLTQDFDRYFYPGNSHSLSRQLAWLQQELRSRRRRPVFVFLNIGETHVPYYHEGAPWDARTNPCVPFGDKNDAAECRRRQAACLEYVDAQLAPLLEQFAGANMLVCADHGDAWGEDGLWEHGFHHPAVLTVPLLFRLQRAPAPGSRSFWHRLLGD